MKKVQLNSGTIGVTASAEIGETVTVLLHNEDGMPFEQTGKVVEILTEMNNPLREEGYIKINCNPEKTD